MSDCQILFAGLASSATSFGIERREIDLVFVHGDAAIVRAAAIGRDRADRVLVVPVLLAGLASSA